MEISNPYSFYVVLADGIMEIPQESNLSWITLFYALPKELVEKRPAYLELPRNIPGNWSNYSGDFPLWRLSYESQAEPCGKLLH